LQASSSRAVSRTRSGSFAICCNGDGSDRLSLWVIGKYKNPRCFKNINKNMDNFSGHIPLDQLPNHIQLRNTTVFYLPPNATSKIQPCNARIIRNFKAYYRCHFNRLLL
jgi:hypothetical protein